MTKIVFVYGTLKKAYHNHHLLERSRFLGEALTADDFDMVDVGFPVLLPQRGEVAFPVRGEVYEVDHETLKRLDRLESEGRMYQRQCRAVILDGSTLPQYADIYVGIPNGDRWGHAQSVQPVDTKSGALERGDAFVAYDWQPRVNRWDDEEDDETQEESEDGEEANTDT